jgi:hypothetical protein
MVSLFAPITVQVIPIDINIKILQLRKDTNSPLITIARMTVNTRCIAANGTTTDASANARAPITHRVFKTIEQNIPIYQMEFNAQFDLLLKFTCEYLIRLSPRAPKKDASKVRMIP